MYTFQDAESNMKGLLYAYMQGLDIDLYRLIGAIWKEHLSFPFRTWRCAEVQKQGFFV